jgi:hypothetical protein
LPAVSALAADGIFDDFGKTPEQFLKAWLSVLWGELFTRACLLNRPGHKLGD